MCASSRVGPRCPPSAGRGWKWAAGFCNLGGSSINKVLDTFHPQRPSDHLTARATKRRQHTHTWAGLGHCASSTLRAEMKREVSWAPRAALPGRGVLLSAHLHWLVWDEHRWLGGHAPLGGRVESGGHVAPTETQTARTTLSAPWSAHWPLCPLKLPSPPPGPGRCWRGGLLKPCPMGTHV